MTRLHPTIESIERSYRAWLEPAVVPSARDEAPADEQAPDASVQKATMPPWISDLISRQVAARPESAEPAVGDLVVLSPEATADHGDDSLPLVMLLDEQRLGHWFGWLVGAHADYAGSQDLMLDRALMTDDRDPAPIAAFVQTWNRVHRPIDSPAPVLQRLTPEAMAAVRELSLAGIETEVEPSPGRMHSRVVAGQHWMTGTPYGRHDPRDGYLLLARELAAMVSEPLLERRDREYGDDEPDV
jgi:hypothetical protein